MQHNDLYVTIEKHEIVNRTFLMPDYVMYFINLHPLNIVCKRNYEDFTKLKATLTEIYPGIRLAYLEKNSWFSSTNIEFIKKQKKYKAHDVGNTCKVGDKVDIRECRPLSKTKNFIVLK